MVTAALPEAQQGPPSSPPGEAASWSHTRRSDFVGTIKTDTQSASQACRSQ